MPDALAKVKDSQQVSSYYRYNQEGEREYISDEEADRYRKELADTYQANCADLTKK